MGSSPRSYVSRAPRCGNLRANPGLRHPSRLHTRPRCFSAARDPFPDCQAKLAANRLPGTSQCSALLIDAMNLFSRQLPNMGTIYISRLVFDTSASTVLVLHEGRAHGAICARSFPEERFVEIAFCAVDYEFQARGYGRLLMDFLKCHVQCAGILDIITCADNEAVTYFQKQGFNRHEILMDPARWVGCIKDYEGITLVHCRLRSDVVYPKFSSALQAQISALRARAGAGAALPPVECGFVPFAQAPLMGNVPLPALLSRCGAAPPPDYSARMAALRARLLTVLDALSGDAKFASVFGRPVTERVAPDYYQKIRRPMDLSTLRKRLTRYRDYYKRPEMFASDIALMCDNCKSFNAPDTPYYRAANELLRRFHAVFRDAFPELESAPRND